MYEPFKAHLLAQELLLAAVKKKKKTLKKGSSNAGMSVFEDTLLGLQQKETQGKSCSAKTHNYPESAYQVWLGKH